MGNHAAAYQTDQCVAKREVGRVLRAARDLFDAVDQRRTLADRMGGGRGWTLRCMFVRHGLSPAAALTDSMILT